MKLPSKLPLIGIVVFIVAAVSYGALTLTRPAQGPSVVRSGLSPAPTPKPTDPLSIAAMRGRPYPGSSITVEETLSKGSNYSQYVVSYLSDGLKINALLTVPDGEKPATGWPVILFNHGYIPADVYRTTERYVAYVDAFARNGYIVFKPDYRGHGESEGRPEGAYYSPAYAIDDLNALSSIAAYKDADPDRIGVWGHSMGGNITLRDLVISPRIRVAVIWGGVVGSYDELMTKWTRRVPFRPSPREAEARTATGSGRQQLVAVHGTPESNPSYWNSIDPTAHIADITAPVQLHAGGDDEEVPVAFSESLKSRLVKAGKTVELYTYPGADHDISQSFSLAMSRSVEFFDRYLKPSKE
jgi:dipeptidyl aminopeptidase/acylaminoacyl peptidase